MEHKILVFKTNIKQKEDLENICGVLTTEHINQWNIDTEDVDCVLRVVTPTLSINDIIKIVTNKGYQCSELN